MSRERIGAQSNPPQAEGPTQEKKKLIMSRSFADVAYWSRPGDEYAEVKEVRDLPIERALIELGGAYQRTPYIRILLMKGNVDLAGELIGAGYGKEVANIAPFIDARYQAGIAKKLIAGGFAQEVASKRSSYDRIKDDEKKQIAEALAESPAAGAALDAGFMQYEGFDPPDIFARMLKSGQGSKVLPHMERMYSMDGQIMDQTDIAKQLIEHGEGLAVLQGLSDFDSSRQSGILEMLEALPDFNLLVRQFVEEANKIKRELEELKSEKGEDRW